MKPEIEVIIADHKYRITLFLNRADETDPIIKEKKYIIDGVEFILCFRGKSNE